MILDTKLTVQEHIKNILSKANKTIGLLWKVQNTLPQTSIFIIYTRNASPKIKYGLVKLVVFNQIKILLTKYF